MKYQILFSGLNQSCSMQNVMKELESELSTLFSKLKKLWQT